jgi:hypothetical protein
LIQTGSAEGHSLYLADPGRFKENAAMLDSELEQAAGKRFEKARLKAFWRSVLSLLTGRDDHLVAWDQARRELHFQGDTASQLKSVPVDHIIGTVGRYEDFDRAFLPTHDGLLGRWRSVDRAHEDSIGLPPIELYQVGDVYFVSDGHHRVSVARQRGVLYLEARVIEVKARVQVDERLDADQLTIKGEYTRFLEHTQLDLLRPEQRIEFSIHGGYDRLLEHIALHVPHANGTASPTALQQAACDWYDHAYLPLVQLIREQGILAGFPGRSEADLYLWLMDHRAELQAQCGPDLDTARVAEHYAERHGRHLLARAASALRDWLSQDACELVASGGAEP